MKKNEMKLLKYKRCNRLSSYVVVLGAILFWWFFDRK
jgi:hypothetical protein